MSDILQERGVSYGPPSVNISRIAALWSSYLGVQISGTDVGWMMAMLKASRSRQDPANADNYLDAHGYITIAEELSRPDPPTGGTHKKGGISVIR